MKLFFPLCLIAFCSCRGQNNASLTFINKAHFDVDSIVLFLPNKIKYEKLQIGKEYYKEIENIEINSGREGFFQLKIYLNGKIFTGSFGFHDYGIMANGKEFFYIFDNGISLSKNELLKPLDFTVYFYNYSITSVDSFINNNNVIKKVNELSPRSYQIIFDFNKIEKEKNIGIILGGKKKNYIVSHDFNNWNENQLFLHYENDSIAHKLVAWREPLEFIIDIDIKLKIPSDSVKVKSNAITKTYFIKQPNYVKVALDFKKLSQDPIITVNVLNKEYKIDLTKHDFSNIYVHQKIYTIDESGIKSIIY